MQLRITRPHRPLCGKRGQHPNKGLGYRMVRIPQSLANDSFVRRRWNERNGRIAHYLVLVKLES